MDSASGVQFFSRHTALTVNDTTRFFIKIDSLAWNDGKPVVVIDPPLRHWTTRDSAFAFAPTFLDVRAAARGSAVGYDGDGWIGTADGWQGPLQLGRPGYTVGDGATGEARSPTFWVTGDSIGFLLGGGRHPDTTSVSLCDATTGRILRSATGANDDSLERRVWAVGSLRGQAAYLRILDAASSGPWGHINVDAVHEFLAPGGDSTLVALPTATLDSPSPGDVIVISDALVARWRLSTTVSVDSISADLSRDGGLTYPTHLGVAGPRDARLVWPAAGPPSDSARVRLTVWIPGGRATYASMTGDAHLVVTNPAFAGLTMGAPQPSPARAGEDVRVAVTLPQGARLAVAVYDIAGRAVRRWSVAGGAGAMEPAAAGANLRPLGSLSRSAAIGGARELVLRWDGRDESGRAVPAGVYVLALRAADRVATRRIVVLR